MGTINLDTTQSLKEIWENIEELKEQKAVPLYILQTKGLPLLKKLIDRMSRLEDMVMRLDQKINLWKDSL